MWLNAIRRLLGIKVGHTPIGRRKSPCPRGRGFRVGLELLEDRLTPTTLVTLVSFNGSSLGGPDNGGSDIIGELLMDEQGDIFGVTAYGGANYDGTVFELTPGSGGYTVHTLANFDGANGNNPAAGLMMDSQGDLFGTTQIGGSNGDGTVFELTPGSGGYTLNTLFNFDGTNGANPETGLVMDSQGDIFGTTQYGGANNEGTVFELTPGSEGYNANTLVNFNTNVVSPTGLVMDSQGDLFGTTEYGGDSSLGSVFELTPGSGYTLNTLVNFNDTNGAYPQGGLELDSQGDIFGTTTEGGADSNFGTVFELTPGSGGGYALNTLFSFNGTNGYLPEGGVVMDSQGDLFGTTVNAGANNVGIVFELTPGSGGYTPNTLVSFDGTNGEEPESGLVMDTNGNLFGTTVSGGVGYGTVFEVIPSPAVSAISPAAGSASGGTTVTITGTDLANASAVDFGSIPGTIVSDDATQIVATSPAGTGTANITITTPGGTSAAWAGDHFNYETPPTVTGVSPASGLTAGGTTITINGTSLASASAVDFGATPGAIVSDTSTQIVATSPAEAIGTVDVTVVNAVGTSATSIADHFTYISVPAVTSVSPASGLIAGGATITITGTALGSATAVDFGTTPGGIVSDTSTQIVATSPAEVAGTVDVTVTNSGGTSPLSAADHFTYVAAPAVTGLTPAFGAATGGTTVTIAGSGLANASAVDFGSTPGAIVSDSATQIVVTSPAEAVGTVDVTVITGVGTSPTTIADHFTYALTADPATSTVTLSSSSVASGSGITVTLQAEDANGDDLTTGGETVTFALGGISGGQGTFGPVNDNGNGTYTATFSGTIAGGNTIVATMNGQEVTSGSPSVTVAPGPVNLSKSLVELESSDVSAGSGDTVTLQAEDAYGNDLAGGGLSVAFSSGGGVGQGTLSAVTDNGNGTYTATFTGTIAGGDTIVATVGGQSIASGTPSITVTPGPVSLAKSVVELTSPTVSAGSGDKLTLQAEDAYGNDLTMGGLSVTFSLGGGVGQGTFSSITDNGNGSYTTTFTGTTAGSNTITATIDSQQVSSGSPSIAVTPGPVSLAKSVVDLTSPTVSAGSSDTITLQAEDAYGNDLTAGGLTVAFILGDGIGQGNLSSVAYNGNGAYTSTFTGTIAGSNTITATINGQAVTSGPASIGVTPGPVSLAKSAIGLSSSSVAAGSTLSVTLQAEDAYGNDLTTGGLTVALLLGSGAGSVTDNGNGTYTATFTGTTAGSDTVRATIGGQAVTSGSPSITVTPGPVDPGNCTAGLASPTAAAGGVDTITIGLADTYGNAIAGGGLDVSLSLGGGTGGGILGEVSSSGDGSYSVPFTATTAGPTSIIVGIAGQPLPPLAVTVVPGPVSLSHCVATLQVGSAPPAASATVQLGGGATVNLQAVDASGNDLTTGGLLVAFQIGGATLTAKDNGNGTYSATVAGTADGSLVVGATIGGTPVAFATPPTLDVTGVAVSAAKSKLTAEPKTIASGASTIVVLQAEGSNGIAETAGGLSVTFGLGSGKGGQGTFGPVTDNGNGTYSATFTGTLAGANTITAAIAGASGSPTAAAIDVTPGPIDLATSVVTVSAVTVKAGKAATVSLQPEDAAGNKINEKGLTVLFAGVSAPGKYTANGTYSGTLIETSVGTYIVTATIGGQALTSLAPSVAIGPAAASAKESLLTLSADTVAVGGAISVTLQAVDAYGNQETSGGSSVAFKLGPGKGKGTFGKVVDNANGTYTVTFTATAAGSIVIEATIGGVKVTSAPTVTIT